MDNVRIIGDVHGKAREYCTIASEAEYSLQIGDMGFSECYDFVDHMMDKGYLNPKRHVFFGGNHDDYHNLPYWHLGDFGAVPFINNSFFIRGAQSIDKDMRTMGYDWWSEEQLGYRSSMDALNQYETIKPDIMFSHDAPDSIAVNMFPDHKLINTHTGRLLSNCYEAHQPKVWIFGHWHIPTIRDFGNTTFICLGELNYITYETIKDFL